jgi:hypothetical protein
MDVTGLPSQDLLNYFPDLEKNRKKIIFGSDWPTITTSIGKNIEVIKSLPLVDNTIKARNRYWGDFSYKHAALAAGLGVFGWSNLILTPTYGARQRLISVVTEAPLDRGVDTCRRTMQARTVVGTHAWRHVPLAPCAGIRPKSLPWMGVFSAMERSTTFIVDGVLMAILKGLEVGLTLNLH